MNLREWALPVYTILMQLATGMLLILWLLRSTILKQTAADVVDKILRKPVAIALITVAAALVGSHFHLSNPWISFLAVMNLGRSWLSREVFFSVLSLLGTAMLVYLTWVHPGERPRIKFWLGWAVVALGAATIFSMSRCYLLPTQPAWNHPTTMALFFCSALILGAVSVFTILVMDAIFSRDYEPDLAEERDAILKWAGRRLVWVALIVAAAIMAMNIGRVLEMRAAPEDAMAQAALALQLELYRLLFDLRFVTLIIGTGMFALVVHWLTAQKKTLDQLVTPAYVTCLLILMAEILGRFLFYAAHVRLGT
ncbi:MAG: dimethyl sulfoxide reductase anchor subunit [Chloroflexi bacterium]|nr:dimethyl sulfoxide reductase anchor subunit [Chloroflexota bacterium]